MTGAHTGRLFAGRYVGVDLHGSREHPLFVVEGNANLEPHVQVTTAGGPHVVGTGRAVGFGVFVVEGQIHTQVHEVIHTDNGVKVSGKGGSHVVEGVGLAVCSIVTATAQGPGIKSDVATGTDGETELAVSSGVVLMDTIGATLDTRLRKCEATGQE